MSMTAAATPPGHGRSSSAASPSRRRFWMKRAACWTPGTVMTAPAMPRRRRWNSPVPGRRRRATATTKAAIPRRRSGRWPAASPWPRAMCTARSATSGPSGWCARRRNGKPDTSTRTSVTKLPSFWPAAGRS